MKRDKAHLTDSIVRTYPAPSPSSRIQVWDIHIKGFLLEVSIHSKRFVVRYRGTYKALGRWPVLTAREARIAALGIIREIEASRLSIRIETSPSSTELKRELSIPAPHPLLHPTLQEVLAEYLGVKKVKERTAADYRYILERHWPDYLVKPLEAITGDTFLERFRSISSPSAGNNSLRIIRALFRFYNAAHDQTLPIPTAKVLALEGAHELQPRSRLILDAQQRDWFHAISNDAGPTCKDLFLLLACTGLRLNEGRTLERRDVDMEQRTLLIRETKNGKPHHMPIGTRTAAILEARLEVLEDSPTSPLFRINERNVRKQLMKVVEALGIEWSAHDLRRGFVSMATRLGVPDRIVKRLVNHAEGDVTGRHYIHLSPDALRPHVQVVEDELWRLWEEG